MALPGREDRSGATSWDETQLPPSASDATHLGLTGGSGEATWLIALDPSKVHKNEVSREAQRLAPGSADLSGPISSPFPGLHDRLGSAHLGDLRLPEGRTQTLRISCWSSQTRRTQLGRADQEGSSLGEQQAGWLYTWTSFPSIVRIPV